MTSIDFNTLNWLELLFVLLALFTSISSLFLFWIHRRNNQQRFEALEEKMHNQDAVVETSIEEQFDIFKNALQQHLSEVSTRINSNEARVYMLINQLDELKSALLEEASVLPETKTDESEKNKEENVNY